MDWDATIIKILDNPISIRQAFWRPYRKFAEFLENTINKFAADKDAKAMNDMTAGVTAKAEGGEAKTFDIGKFAGIFAALGLAFGGIVAALAVVAKTLGEFKFWQWVVLIAVILLIISGPAMIMAWLKLRKRNLSPILNANGWAVNAKALVNTRFGATLTSVADMPRFSVNSDPYSMSPWKKWLIGIAVALVAAFCALYFTNSLECIGLHYESNKNKKIDGPAATEVTVDNADVLSETPVGL